MQDDHYEIEVDFHTKLVRLKLIGFWGVETAAAFARDQQAAVRRVCSQPDQHLVLADLSEFSLQSQAVVKVCQDLITVSPLKSRRLAVVAGDGLAKIQIKRILLRDRMRAFSHVKDAMAWLLDETGGSDRTIISQHATQTGSKYGAFKL